MSPVASRRWSRGVREVDAQLRDLENALGRTPMFFAIRAVTTTFTLLDSDDVVLVDATSGAITGNLPAAALFAGRRFTVKKTDASGNAVILDGAGAETIDGAATLSFTVRYTAYTVHSDGTQWWIV